MPTQPAMARVSPAVPLRALCDFQPERRQLHPAHAEGGASQTLVHGDAVADAPLIVGHHVDDPALGEFVDVDTRTFPDAGRGGGGGIGARDRTAGRRHGQDAGGDCQDWERQYTIYAHESPPRWGDLGLDRSVRLNVTIATLPRTPAIAWPARVGLATAAPWIARHCRDRVTTRKTAGATRGKDDHGYRHCTTVRTIPGVG